MTMETDRETRREAYRMGYSDSIELTTDEIRDMTEDHERPEQSLHENFHYYTSGARWCNTVLPKLRAMAGYDDPGGRGTYTDGGVAEIRRLDEIVESYRDGWIDKSLGYDEFHSRPQLRPEEEA